MKHYLIPAQRGTCQWRGLFVLDNEVGLMDESSCTPWMERSFYIFSLTLPVLLYHQRASYTLTSCPCLTPAC